MAEPLDLPGRPRRPLGGVDPAHVAEVQGQRRAFGQPGQLLDAVAAGGEFLKDRGYQRAWGIGRHIQGSQIFDYWRDPDSVMVEHYADGDLFDSSVEVGWAPMTASGLAQWGPSVTRDFMGAKPSPHLIRDIIGTLRDDENEFDVRRLLGLLKVASS